MNPTARSCAVRILIEFEKQQTRLDVLFPGTRDFNLLAARDKRQSRALVSGVLRHRAYLNWIIERLYKGRAAKLQHGLRAALQLGLFEIIHQQSIPEAVSINEYVNLVKKGQGIGAAKLVNAVLRNFLRQRANLQPVKIIKDAGQALAVECSFPQWLIERWIGRYGVSETRKLCRALNTTPAFDVQINQALISIAEFRQRLESLQIAYKPSAYFDDVFTVTSMQPLLAAGLLEEGLCHVQDESASLPVRLLNPQANHSVLDVCAAPGSKYLQILKNKPRLAVAVDTDLGRLKRVRENVQRMHLAGGNYVCADGRNLPFKNTFDKILLDAPCSGLGVIGKHPDIKWRRTAEEVAVFARLQSELLQNSSRLLSEDGRLAYSTCTIEDMENGQVVQQFLATGSNWVKDDLPVVAKPFEREGSVQCLPHKHHTDGSFCTILCRK